MHPAPSVIFFSTFSGLGFGLLVFLGLGMPGGTGWSAFAFFSIAYILAVGGLISSTFHLGRPERALKAFTQWRTSWLSREAWCAVLALVLMAIYGAGLVFFGQRWTILGLLGAAASLVTVFTTSMIYGQLNTIPRWHSPYTPANFISLCIAGGALLSGQAIWAIALLCLAAGIQIATWLRGDTALAASGTNMQTATGLGQIGRVRAFEPPHTGTNYLLREFVHVIGRKHSNKLRIIAIVLMAVLPVFFLLVPFNHFMALFAVVSHIGGVLTARWLFFAEAEHVVGLYYGKR
ncbi:dimethyl sulfoxide reductase anchor subunit family protein [Sulfitobacter guttiformis]|uniref:DMSO reductase anchor subunit n=1 Tax=Sulfitobacter guttiformis TaxID=74349 RepID=A0A420DRD3_9RHOB|nr:DmsC/YnfH family molybdoenzyme membrane anchor subunit [Sulfitobacter guttiformis]KIN74092.1 Anaerobic dimethyl sulfoxide reductase, C subunit [Sulfitobacter guttiformis KCTC 32187]RKE96709.1 DMSO reductase anchor subunit [Sulfitobacter guttiformis]